MKIAIVTVNRRLIGVDSRSEKKGLEMNFSLLISEFGVVPPPPLILNRFVSDPYPKDLVLLVLSGKFKANVVLPISDDFNGMKKSWDDFYDFHFRGLNWIQVTLEFMAKAELDFTNNAIRKLQLALLQVQGIQDENKLFAAGSLISKKDYEDVVTEKFIL
ncbi:hypothetical protein C5167_022061, partial [Papaver somniferum]